MKTMAIAMILALAGCTVEVADEAPIDVTEDAGHGGYTADASADAGHDWSDAEADAGEAAGVCALYCVTTGGSEWCYAAGLSPDAYPAGARCAEWE
jgi:hypothetical protein